MMMMMKTFFMCRCTMSLADANWGAQHKDKINNEYYYEK